MYDIFNPSHSGVPTDRSRWSEPEKKEKKRKEKERKRKEKEEKRKGKKKISIILVISILAGISGIIMLLCNYF